MGNTTASGWTLRPALPEDDSFLETLFCQLHAADFAGVPLPEEQIRGLVQMQARAQRLGYLRDFPAARSSIVMVGASHIGRVLVDFRSDDLHLVDIALSPEWQGQGIGTKLMRDLQAEARQHDLPLHLNVFPQNPALNLYNRLGFRIISGGLQLGMEWRPTGKSESEENGSQSDGDLPSSESSHRPGGAAEDYTQLRELCLTPFPVLTGSAAQTWWCQAFLLSLRATRLIHFGHARSQAMKRRATWVDRLVPQRSPRGTYRNLSWRNPCRWFQFASPGFQACDGSLLSISTYAALFALLGTTYGGDGVSTFAVPDRRGLIPIHQGTGAGLSTYASG